MSKTVQNFFRFSSNIALVLIFTLSLTQFGCVRSHPLAKTDVPPPLQPSDRYLVVARNGVENNAANVGDTVDSETHKQITAGVVGGTAGGALGAAAALAPYTLYPPFAVIIAGAAVIGGVGAGIYEGFTAPSGEDLGCVTQKFTQVLNELHVNEMLALELQRRLREDAEVTLPIIQDETEYVDSLCPKLVFAEMDVVRYANEKKVPIVLKSTLLRKSYDGSIRSFGNIDIELGPRSFDEWCKLEDNAWRKQLTEAVGELAQRMSEQLLVPREMDRLSGSECPSYRGLATVDPPAIDENRFLPVVGSVQPTLQWEAFPRQVDLKADPKLASSVTNVVYDLMIWKPEFDPEYKYNYHSVIDKTLVYSMTELTETSHRVETDLEHNTIYAWAVRPHFYIEGRRRVLPWSKLTYKTDKCLLKLHSDREYFFITP